MSAHSKTPYITPSMDFSSGEGVVRGRGGQQLGFALPGLRGGTSVSHICNTGKVPHFLLLYGGFSYK